MRDLLKHPLLGRREGEELRCYFSDGIVGESGRRSLEVLAKPFAVCRILRGLVELAESTHRAGSRHDFKEVPKVSAAMLGLPEPVKRERSCSSQTASSS